MPNNALCKKVKPIGTWTIMSKTFTVYGTEKEPLILAKDVAVWIDYSKNSEGKYKVSQMMQLVDEDEKGIYIVGTLGGDQKMWFVKEDGLYELLMLNRTEQGKKFKKEVKRILKHLREDGAYIVKDKDADWNKVRLESKETRRAFTNHIKELVEYAKASGSRNADR